jgi:hypothetical protein
MISDCLFADDVEFFDGMLLVDGVGQGKLGTFFLLIFTGFLRTPTLLLLRLSRPSHQTKPPTSRQKNDPINVEFHSIFALDTCQKFIMRHK